jgi:hypothetical protein
MKNKNRIINYLLIVILLITFNYKRAYSQIDELIQIRNLLLPLTPPSPQPPFLYDLSAHLLDEATFVSHNSVDTIISLTWWQALHEMRYAAYDTTLISNIYNLRDDVKQYKKDNKLPLAAFNFDYATFIDSAFGDTYNGVYYSWDDYSISDVFPRPDEPYLQKNAFLGSLLIHDSYFRDVTIAIDPQFFFIGNQYMVNPLPSNLKLKVDFGDGNGWTQINYSTYNEITINYPDSGTYLVQIGLFDCDGNCEPIYLSQSYIHVENPTPRFPGVPLGYNVEGLNVSVYSNCETGNKKYLILLEGIDFFEDTHADELYSKSIANPRISRLINYGYDVIVVDWVNSKWDIRSNAMRVIHLIDYLKCKVADDTREEIMEQFVIIGQSLGGVIGRTALTYMETEEYHSSFVIPNIIYGDGEPSVTLYACPNGQDLRNQMHNTKLFVSYDSPQQGANVPVGIQHSYYELGQALPTGLMVGPFIKNLFESGKEVLDNIINTTVVKQLLIYHYSTENNNQYTEHLYRRDFMNQLLSFQPILNNPSVVVDREKQGYPIYCKLATYTDGLITGENQIGLRGAEARIGDKIFEVFIDMDLQIMKTKLNYYNLNYTVNSAGGVGNTNNILSLNALTYRYNTWGCLRAFLRRKKSNKKTCGTIDKNITINKYGKDLIAYDSGPGGNVSMWNLFNTLKLPTSGSNYISVPFLGNSLNIGSYEYKYDVDLNSGQINANISMQSLIKAISANSIINFSTQMPAFAFIPERSSLDYDYHSLAIPPVTYNSNFLSRMTLNFSEANHNSTPFDLVFGFVNNTGDIMYSTNRSHCFMENFKLSSDNSVLFMNQEIGDKDSYYYSLNLNAGRGAIFSSSSNIYFGTINPNYRSISNTFPSPFFNEGVMTREDNLNTYFNNIKIQGTNASSSAGGFLNAISTSFNYDDFGYDPCQFSDEELGSLRTVSINSEKDESGFVLYPNPASDYLNIYNSEFNENDEINIVIYDNLGKLVNVIETKNQITSIDFSSLSEGVYLINISNNKGKTSKHKIIKFK